MAVESKIQNTDCELHPFERNRYFYGKLMTSRDFEAEQRYLIGKDRLINRHVHGVGIVCGLELSNPEVDDGILFVDLDAGLGLDCCGHEIVVGRPTSHIRVSGNLQQGTNYIYLHYTECVKEPVPALANASTCEEVCCYNRLQETYEVRVRPDPPVVTDATLTGTVQQQLVDNTTAPLPGARVEALDPDGIVHTATLTDETGSYTLAVVANTYVVRASATGFQSASTAGTSVAAGQTITLPAFTLVLDASEPDATTRCHDMTQQYYEEHLRVCPRCEDPKVLLAVVTMSAQGQVSLDVSATQQHRAILYSNPMLHDLLCDHVADFHNPHHTTAADVKALQSVNNVGNVEGLPHVSNIDLVSSNSTIQINPQPDSQRIDITTIPAVNVTSVGPTPIVGNSLNFARENHVHDLANEVVQRDHLNNDVINNLLTSDGTITITPDTTNRTVNLRTTPAESVTSVGANPEVGTSLNYAREDHIHNLQINGQGPDANGELRLIPGANIEIALGAQSNELVISATGNETVLDISSGRVIFEDMNGLDEIRQSPSIQHNLRAEHIAIVLALELGSREPQDRNGFRVMGDTAFFPPPTQESPLMWAVHSNTTPDQFVIILQDRRPFGQTEDPPPPVTLIVRWWAIPKTQELGDLIALPPSPLPPEDFVVGRIVMRPGIRIDDLAQELLGVNVTPDEFRELLERLQNEGRIRIEQDRLFPQDT